MVIGVRDLARGEKSHAIRFDAEVPTTFDGALAVFALAPARHFTQYSLAMPIIFIALLAVYAIISGPR